MTTWTEYSCVFFEQLLLFMRKILRQKWTNGRETIKEFLIPLVLIGMTIYIFSQSVNSDGFFSANYALIRLPPLADSHTTWGIFQAPPGDDDNNDPSLNYVSKERLYYSPNTHAGVNALMDKLKNKYPAVNVFGQESSSDVSTQYEENMFTTWAALNFDLTEDQIASGSLLADDETGGISNVKYTIRMNPQVAILPDFTTDHDVYRDAVASADWYAKSGYLTLQNFVSSYVSGLYPGVENDFSVDMFVQRYPYTTDQEEAPGVDYETLRFFLWKWMGSTILTLAIFLPVLMILIQPVKERCSRMKDLLQISGMLDTAYYMSYILGAFIVIMAISVICVLFLGAGNVLSEHHFGPYLALLSCYGLGLIAFSLAFGFVIPRPEFIGLPLYILQAGLAVGGCYLANDYSIPIGLKLFIGTIFPPINFTNAIFAIEVYLYHHSGDAMDFNHVDFDKNLPSLNGVCACLLVSTALYFFFAVGMPFDWLFSEDGTAASIAANMRDDDQDKEDIEDIDGAIEAGLNSDVLSVRDLTQVYPDGTKAVKGITFSVASGEILSFLGANGAGKSTTMSMLSGTLAPSFGDAIINGHSITRDKTMACRNLGICMQQDVIWEDISIRDHLLLFGRLRGLHGKKLQDNVDSMLETLGFPEKAHSLAGTLSGGQKRRLCVGISMVGDNPVVFLDEPTAGLDPVSRRQLWELVQANRHNRAILLTTHFMDEADVLGDRIAIVKEGHVRAIGSSRYLKKKFGVGYLLRTSLEPEVDKKPIIETIQSYIPAAELVSDAGTELSLRLPLEASELFPRLFEELEGPGKARGILSFGIETTTLEEVFMNIVNEDTSASNSVHEADKLIGASSAERSENLQALLKKDSKKHPVTDADVALMLTPGSTNFEFSVEETWSQTKNMLDKRKSQFFRSKGQRIFGFIFPLVVLCLIGAVMDKVPTEVTDSDPSPTNVEYNEWFTTPIAARTEALAAEYAAAASISDYTYVGDSYESVYNYVYDETQGGAASLLTNSSGDSLFFEAYNNFTVLYNATLPLNFPGVVGDVLNSITSNVTDNQLTIETVNQPFPISTISEQLNYGIIAMLMLALCAGSIGGGISIVLSGERVQLVKHQQLASGASRFAYWFANFLTDGLVILVQLFFFVIILAVVSKSDYTNEGAGVVLAGGILWVLNLIFRFYIFSFFISEVRAAQTFYFYGSLMSMYIFCVVYVIIVQDASSGDVNTGLSRATACVVSALDPTVAYGLVIFYQKNFLGVRSTNGDVSALDNDVAGLLIMVMGLTIIVYFIVFVFMELGFVGFFNTLRDLFRSCCGSKDSSGSSSLLGVGPAGMTVTEDSDLSGFVEIAASGAMDLDKKIDEDVNRERHRIEGIFERKQLNVKQHAIFIHHLSKIYYGRGAMKTKIAVKEFNLAVAQGEVFGLLGANGAGKTTLLKMVSGLETPTGGAGVINGFDVVSQTSKAQRSMGLCPQFDTLIERYSVLENLYFFASVKGIEQSKISTVVEAFMRALNIKKYENKLIQHLSGGNRRKVSLAVALLGCPPTVYLDEPSTGLDPVASRLMWRLLSSVAAKKTSAIVLTTHNMLECEAVCTRVGVMKNGELVCLGSSQHLRNVHGTGFLFEVVLSTHDTEAVRRLKQFVEDNFAEAAVVDEHGAMINYEIPRKSINKLSEAFRLMESNKQKLLIADYSLSQSTLEQVFLKQIRPTNAESTLADQQRIGGPRVPTFQDYFLGYLIWLLAFFLPGLHHFYLGNTARGFKYLFTINEFLVGWVLDLFELHMLIRKSVDEFGNARCCAWCRSSTGPVGCTNPADSSSYDAPQSELNVN